MTNKNSNFSRSDDCGRLGYGSCVEPRSFGSDCYSLTGGISLLDGAEPLKSRDDPPLSLKLPDEPRPTYTPSLRPRSSHRDDPPLSLKASLSSGQEDLSSHVQVTRRRIGDGYDDPPLTLNFPDEKQGSLRLSQSGYHDLNGMNNADTTLTPGQGELENHIQVTRRRINDDYNDRPLRLSFCDESNQGSSRLSQSGYHNLNNMNTTDATLTPGQGGLLSRVQVTRKRFVDGYDDPPLKLGFPDESNQGPSRLSQSGYHNLGDATLTPGQGGLLSRVQVSRKNFGDGYDDPPLKLGFPDESKQRSLDLSQSGCHILNTENDQGDLSSHVQVTRKRIGDGYDDPPLRLGFSPESMSGTVDSSPDSSLESMLNREPQLNTSSSEKRKETPLLLSSNDVPLRLSQTEPIVKSNQEPVILLSASKTCPPSMNPPSMNPPSRSFFDVVDYNSSSSKPKSEAASVTNELMGLIPLDKLEMHSRKESLLREFSVIYSEDLKLYVSRKSSSVSLLEINFGKNRYTNVLTYNDTRVILNKLPGIEGSDFINANWIWGITTEGEKDDHFFIATQGPLPDFEDFWRMVWEKGSRIIVFLGKEFEKGQMKVDHYWPDLEKEPGQEAKIDPFGDVQQPIFAPRTPPPPERESPTMKRPHITVTAVKEEIVIDKEVVKRTFLLSETNNPAEQREVYQFQYGGWPDQGAPTSSASIRKLIYMVREIHGTESVPIIVHCSAGIGRTGAFCAIYSNIQVMLSYMKKHESDGVIEKIREESLQRKANKHDGSDLRRTSVLLKNRLAESGSFVTREESTSSLLSGSSFGDSSFESSSSSTTSDALSFNMFQTVLSLRKCRAGMVQSPDQYMFCYKAIIDELREQRLLPPEEAEEKSSEPDFSKRVSYLEPDPSDRRYDDGYSVPDSNVLNSSIDYSHVPTKTRYDPVNATTISSKSPVPHHP